VFSGLCGLDTRSLTANAAAPFDTFIGTANNDTFTAATGTLQDEDTIIDQSSVDNDTLNAVFKSADINADPLSTITGVENINIDIDAFTGTDTTLDAVNVSGATITLSSTKLGFNGAAGVENVGDNNVTAGQNVDTLTVAGLEAGVVNTGSAETVVVTALTAAAGEEINLTINGDIDATITFNAPAIETLNLVATAASVVTLNAASVVAPANLTIAGSGDLSIDADAVDVTGATVTGVDVLNIVDLTGGLDAENLSVNTIEVSDTAAVAVTNANGQVIDLSVADAGLTVSGDSTTGAATTLNVTADQTGSAGGLTVDGVDTSIINLSDAVTQIAVSLTIEGEATVNVLGDVTIDNLVASNTTDTAILAGTGDVTLITTNLQSIDASGLTGALDADNSVIGDVTVSGGTGDNVVDFTGTTTAGTDTYVGQSGDDTVTFATTTGNVEATFAGGANSVEANLLTTGTLSVAGGAGVETISATGLLTGTIAGSLAGGDDTVTLGGAVTAATLAIDFGLGNDTLVLGASEDLSTASFNVVSLENITIDTAAIFTGAQLTGDSYNIAGTTGNETLTVNGAGTADTIDLSGLVLSNTVGSDVKATLNGGAGNDTLTGTSRTDTITGGVGADSLTGDAGNDTFFFADAAADTGITVATADVIQDFNTGSDQIDINTAAAGVAWVNNTTVGGVNIATTVAADFAGALTAANGVLTGTVDQYAFQHDGTNGYLFIDDDGTAGADSVIVLAGIDNTEFAFGDVIA